MNIAEEIYRDKVYGCWLGKSIGGTIGGPLEGKKQFLDVPLEYPKEAIENDDLDLQLVWLSVLRETGIRITAEDLARAWLDHITYPWDEYGVAIANLRMGLKPPVTGFYNNWFKDSMGAPIRSEIWACLFPGRPAVATWYAIQDAEVDHWGEGVYGEIFFAALESMAFVETDIKTLVDRALEYIPTGSRVHRAVAMACRSFADGHSLRESRDLIVEYFGHHNFTDAPQNLAFTVLGLLHSGGEFLKSIVYSAMCGYDVDCTAATAGSIAGIMAGGKVILDSCETKVDDRIVVGWGVKDCDPPGTVAELTDQTVALGLIADQETDLPQQQAPFSLSRVPSFDPPMRIPCHFDQIPDDVGEQQPLLTEAAQEIIFEGAFFDVEDMLSEDDAMLVIETCLDLDEPKRLRLVPHCTGPVALWVDNRLHLNWPQSGTFMPASSRLPPNSGGKDSEIISLDAGIHEITIRIRHPEDGRRLEFAWIVSDEDRHWVTDLSYILQP